MGPMTHIFNRPECVSSFPRALGAGWPHNYFAMITGEEAIKVAIWEVKWRVPCSGGQWQAEGLNST